jgi:hypothetical protein
MMGVDAWIFLEASMNRMRMCRNAKGILTVDQPEVLNKRWSERNGIRVVTLLVCGLLAILEVCGTTSYAQALQPQPFPNSPELVRAVAVQAANQPALLATEGVRGVGIGTSSGGSLSLLVLVDNTNTAALLPSSLDGLPVSTMAVGTIHVVQCAANNPQVAYPLPVPLGVSGGNALLFGGCCASGTIGFKVHDNTSGTVGWISNNHVVGHGTDGCPSTAPVGTPEYQPGSVDTDCGPGQNIGALARTVPINFSGGDNLVDCGFVQSSDLEVSSDFLNLGPQVNSVVPAFVGQFVRKNGRTTDCTEGTVTAVNLTVNVDYTEPAPCATTCGTATFTNQIMIIPVAPSTEFAAAGDSGSPIVDADNNAVGLLFAGDSLGDAIGNPMGAVLSALNVSLASGVSSQVITRTSRYWFTHAFSLTDTNCATLLKAIQADGSVMPLGFVTLPTADRNADNVIDAYDTLIEALSFYYRSTAVTGEPGGLQSDKLKASSLCVARKKLAVELIAAEANAALFGTFPGMATYTSNGTTTNFPPDLISQAQAVGAGYDPVAINAMTALLKKFNSSGLTNNLPNGLLECDAQTGKIPIVFGTETNKITLKQISQDPMTQATCPGVNNSCAAAQVVVFPNASDPFAKAVFTSTVNLSAYTPNMPSPACSGGGRDAVWKILPSMGINGRQFTASTAGSNFKTMLAVWTGDCNNSGADLVAVSCVDTNVGLEGTQLVFNTDGTNTFYIAGEGPSGQYGRLKIRITSP